MMDDLYAVTSELGWGYYGRTTLEPDFIGFGDLTIQQPWQVGASEKYVIFVDGNLNLTDGDGSSDQLLTVDSGGFLMFIVSGNITIDDSLGNSTVSSNTPNLEAVLVADGFVSTGTNGSGADDKLVVEGTVVGWGGVNLQRDLSGANDYSYSAETFIYRPDFVLAWPEELQDSQLIWQETNVY